MKYANPILNEREKTHGNFALTALTAQLLKCVIAEKTSELSFIQQESLDLICTKIGRIVSGNPNEPDHWRDIAGYASLIAERLSAAQSATPSVPPAK